MLITRETVWGVYENSPYYLWNFSVSLKLSQNKKSIKKKREIDLLNQTRDEMLVHPNQAVIRGRLLLFSLTVFMLFWHQGISVS